MCMCVRAAYYIYKGCTSAQHTYTIYRSAEKILLLIEIMHCGKMFVCCWKHIYIKCFQQQTGIRQLSELLYVHYCPNHPNIIYR